MLYALIGITGEWIYFLRIFLSAPSADSNEAILPEYYSLTR